MSQDHIQSEETISYVSLKEPIMQQAAPISAQRFQQAVVNSGGDKDELLKAIIREAVAPLGLGSNASDEYKDIIRPYR